MEFIGRTLDAAVAQFAAAVEDGDPVEAAAAIGRQWGEQGVGIGPSLDDLESVHRIVLGADPPPPLVRAFADAWAERALDVLLGRGALDHRTGLATSDYLLTRLRDLARTGAAAERRLVVADPPGPAVPRLAAFLRSARAAAELAASFPDAETPVGMGRAGRIVAIVPADDGFAANLARARLALGAVDGVERGDVAPLELPSTEAAVAAFVRRL